MSFFQIFKSQDINRGVAEYRTVPGAVLLDVRTPQEYREGHIPGSRNVPLDHIAQAKTAVQDLSTPLFVHCYSGVRSRQAVAALEKMGYTNVKNIGGIAAWNGKVE